MVQLTRAQAMDDPVKASGVYLNRATRISPNTRFGGLGQSGCGREGGRKISGRRWVFHVDGVFVLRP